ncbi:MAG TPA: mannose-1-phosphate guanylyltransferase/mannose-6-phosphate isomerase [Beijerinckiaceae bacterium]|nr:mannose-1-phosphate guanylyltransferase/mannose-6-phosphate isomerase [Beijerinckiaceae bacterium]
MPGVRKMIPIIMCGGAGTRLWPVSRDSMPKQFVRLFGEESTFQRTVRLLSDRSVFEAPIVLTATDYRFTVEDQLKAIGIDCSIVLEPQRRDSAAAVAVATLLSLQRDPDAIVGVFAADHVVQDGAGFVATCALAARTAAAGRIVTIGIRPTHPATGYGYIKPGAPTEPGSEARIVEAFVEKPDAARAERYVLDGYLWNSGNFIFHGATMASELEKHAADVLHPAADAVATAKRDLAFTVLGEEAFSAARKIAIDFAVMEKTTQAAVVPGSFGWSDVGGWAAVWDLSDKDEDGNAIIGKGHVLEGRNNLVRSEDGVVGVVGLSDIAVVSTRDATLVVPRDRADRVKELVEQLRLRGEPAASAHREIHRPWGKYVSIDSGARHQVKRITVKPGGVLSLQKHFHRAEHWVVVRGTAEVTREKETIIVHENESIYLPIGCVHRMKNPGKIDLDIIEVQVGSYFGEDDIVRLEDVYRRT